MGLPARDEAREWVGWTCVDREGAELGAVTAVLADQSTGRPEWVYVDVEGASAVVPALDADGSGGRVTVAVTRAQVTAAPSVGGGRELSTEQEADLYRHYGIQASNAASETLLPAAATGRTSAGAGTTSPADTAPAGASGSTGRGAVLAAGALAAVAGLGVVRTRARRAALRQPWHRRLWARRPWAPRPPSRAELVAGQVLALSARTAQGTRHLGRTAAPLVLTAAESARHRAVLGAEELRHLGALASQAAEAAVARARG